MNMNKKRELLHVSLDDPKYGGGQFIGKLFTEGLGRMPDPVNYRKYQELILEELCTKETLLKIAKRVFMSSEYDELKLCPKRQAITLYRSILNRDPSYEEILEIAGQIGSFGAARALAYVKGREFVTDEDLAVLAAPVLAHRVRLRDPKAHSDKFIREICLARIDGIKTG